MKVSSCVRVLAACASALLLACVQAGAQDFALLVTPSASPAIVSNSLTYTITLTNQSGLLLPNVFVTNSLSASVANASATSSQGTVFASGSNFIFDLGQMLSGSAALMTLRIQPTEFGFITNAVTVATLVRTNVVATNVVTQVIAARADLGVSVTAPASGVFTGDWMVYGVTVTNAGPDAAPNVILSNALPADVGLIGVSPAGQSFIVTNGTVFFNFATLTNSGSITLNLTVQPTNAGSLTFVSSVSAAGVIDTNTVNDTASTNVTVGSYLSGQLTATNVSAMTYVPQTGLMIQKVRLANVGASVAVASRVIVAGLTNRLFDAVGTNNGNPFVGYGAALSPGESVDFMLEYFVPSRLPVSIPDSAYAAVEVPLVNVPVPAGTAVQITKIKPQSSGGILIEFPSVAGKNYTILYSDNVQFSNALVAQPVITAPANRLQWIDYGPPKTLNAPMNSASKFYRALQTP